MEPISVWELDDGIARYHVPAFQSIAVKRSERTTQTQNILPFSAITSRGRRWTIPIATQIPQRLTQRKFIVAAKSTARFGLSEWEYIIGDTAFEVSLEPFTNSKTHTSARQRTRRIIIPILTQKIIIKIYKTKLLLFYHIKDIFCKYIV
jgi:hypothetical protein